MKPVLIVGVILAAGLLLGSEAQLGDNKDDKEGDPVEKAKEEKDAEPDCVEVEARNSAGDTEYRPQKLCKQDCESGEVDETECKTCKTEVFECSKEDNGDTKEMECQNRQQEDCVECYRKTDDCRAEFFKPNDKPTPDDDGAKSENEVAGQETVPGDGGGPAEGQPQPGASGGETGGQGGGGDGGQDGPLEGVISS